MRVIDPVFLALAGCVFGGCMVGPNYHPPRTKLPADYTEAKPPASVSSAALKKWWTYFHDDTLTSLEERALQNNRDLQIAISRLREARWEEVEVSGSLLPQADVTAGYFRGRGSKNVILPFGGKPGGNASGAAGSSASPSSGDSPSSPHFRPLQVPAASGANQPGAGSAPGGSAAGVPPGGPGNPLGAGGFPGATTNLFQAGFDVAWEIDLFGGTRRSVEAAEANIGAAAEGVRAVQVSLLAEVASTYVELRSQQRHEEIARRNLRDQDELLALARDKYKAGFMTEEQVAQQQAEVDQTQAMLPEFFAAEHAARHALAYLLGVEPAELNRELAGAKALPDLPAALPVGLPSELLRRRPDIRQAERELAAATAEVGVAVARFFPRFSLTGTAGWDSSTIKALPDWASHYYSISPGIDWPILNWSRLQAAVHAQTEAQKQALLTYENVVAQALREVEDALVQYEAEKERHRALADAVQASHRALAVARQTYANGLADELATIDAERTVFQAEDALTQSDARLRTDLIALYKALGGGWAP